MILSSVVLPEPDGPSSATKEPSAMSRLTPLSAEAVPKVLTRLSIVMVMIRYPWSRSQALA